MKKILLMIIGAVVMAGCSSDDPGSGGEVPVTHDAIAMNVYTGSYAHSRAAGLNNLADLANAGGFGVFCYNTGTTKYEAGQTSFASDYMFDQLVTGTASEGSTSYTWSYSPVKYWANDPEQNFSFFGYAPHSSKDEAITTMDINTKGDPTITYTSSSDADATDILRAEPVLNEQHQTSDGKQTVDSKVLFKFNHAMAKIGGANTQASGETPDGLCVMLDVDKDGNVSGGLKPADTKVTIKEIKMRVHGYHSAAGGETTTESYTSATLNLATGVWSGTKASAASRGYYSIEASSSSETSETSGASTLNESLAEPATVASFEALPAGVTLEAQNVYAQEASPFLIIPDGTIPVIEFTVTYVVRTKDAGLEKGYSEVPQTITRYVVLNKAAEPARRYNITMHLGLNSLKFTGDDVAWDFNSEVHFDDKTQNPGTKDQYILDVDEGEPTPEDNPYLSKKSHTAASVSH